MIYKAEKPFEYMDKIQDLKVKCTNCGHTSVMPVYVDTKICNHCKHKIQNNSKEYFNYKLRKMVKEKEMEYKLEEIKEMKKNGYIISYYYYKVLNYDGNKEKLKEYIKKLNDNSMFNIDYCIYKVQENEAIIEKVIDTLD